MHADANSEQTRRDRGRRTAHFEAMLRDLGELSVDVDDDEGKQVRIRCE